MMTRRYEYHGFTVEVSVESDFLFRPSERMKVHSRYVAIVNVYRDNHAITTFSPLRFGVAGGQPFAIEVDALMGGYSAARGIIDDLCSRGADLPGPDSSLTFGQLER
jgi:hypothetical protein